MNRSLRVIVTVTLMLPLAAVAQSKVHNASMPAPMAGHQLQSLIASAHSNAQYKQLADEFRQQETAYRAEAATEKIERDRRAAVNAALMQKYPRPVDEAQYLYESCVAKADSAAVQAKYYDHLAAGEQPQNAGKLASAQGKL